MSGDPEGDGLLVRLMRERVADWGGWPAPDAFETWRASDPATRGDFPSYFARFTGVAAPTVESYGATETVARAPGCIEHDVRALFPPDALGAWRRSVPPALAGYLDPAAVLETPSDVLAAEVCAALGADRACVRDFGPARNAAWFMTAALRLHAAAFATASVAPGRLGWTRDEALVALGSLLERARWRASRLEQGAAMQRDNARRFAAIGGDRATRNARRKADAEQWHGEARKIAREAWARNIAPSANAMAPRVAAELAARGVVSADGLSPSVRAVRRVIAAVKPRP